MQNLEKKQTNKNGKILWKYKHHCSILISSLLSFSGLFANERIHSIIISLIQKKAHHKAIHMSCPVSSWCVHIPSNSFFFSFQFCHSYHQQLFLEPFFSLLSICNQVYCICRGVGWGVEGSRLEAWMKSHKSEVAIT